MRWRPTGTADDVVPYRFFQDADALPSCFPIPNYTARVNNPRVAWGIWSVLHSTTCHKQQTLLDVCRENVQSTRSVWSSVDMLNKSNRRPTCTQHLQTDTISSAARTAYKVSHNRHRHSTFNTRHPTARINLRDQMQRFWWLKWTARRLSLTIIEPVLISTSIKNEKSVAISASKWTAEDLFTFCNSMTSYQENNRNILVCRLYSCIYHSQTWILVFIIEINIYNVKRRRFISRTTATETVRVYQHKQNKHILIWHHRWQWLPKNNDTKRQLSSFQHFLALFIKNLTRRRVYIAVSS